MRGASVTALFVGALVAVLMVCAGAQAGAGGNGVVNRGVSNSVRAKTALPGAAASAQLQVTNTNTVGGAFGLGVSSASPSATGSFTNSSSGIGVMALSTTGTGISAQTGGAATPALAARNTGGGPAAKFTVNA